MNARTRIPGMVGGITCGMKESIAPAVPAEPWSAAMAVVYRPLTVITKPAISAETTAAAATLIVKDSVSLVARNPTIDEKMPVKAVISAGMPSSTMFYPENADGRVSICRRCITK